MKGIALLGSTGSIGTQSLDVCRMHGYRVVCLTANRRVDLMEAQIREFRPDLVSMMDPVAADDLRTRVADTGTKVLSGMDGLIECATYSGADTVLNAVVGMVGLQPTLAAIQAKKTLALANKETLVVSGRGDQYRQGLRCGYFAGGQRALRHLSVPARQPGKRRGEETDLNRFRRTILWQDFSGAGKCDGGGRLKAS